MDWDAIGVNEEVIGAAAVVLSLGYLAVQIKQQNRMSRRATTLALTAQGNKFMSPLVYSDDMTGVFVRGIKGVAMSDEETAPQFAQIAHSTPVGLADGMSFASVFEGPIRQYSHRDTKKLPRQDYLMKMEIGREIQDAFIS